MPKDKNAKHLRTVRHIRLRKKVTGTPDRPRLAVFRSLRHIYAQVIDDTTGRTLASASSDDAIKEAGGPITPKTTLSTAVGKLVAERAKAAGWGIYHIDSGHDPMITNPEELAGILLEIAGNS